VYQCWRISLHRQVRKPRYGFCDTVRCWRDERRTRNCRKYFGCSSLFLLGAFIAGLLIDRPIHYGRKPRFDRVMGLSAVCLLLATVSGEVLHFGAFAGVIGAKESFLLMMLLCLASGLQNGAITSSSGKSVRTTHLTGLTTDLGLGLARVFTFDLKNLSLQKEVRANYLRIGSIVSFIIGSAVGACFFMNLGYRGFLISAMIAGYAAWHGRLAKIAPHTLAPPQ
jgi:uncharacterized membrane protein YoaK (UPF0700 family)